MKKIYLLFTLLYLFYSVGYAQQGVRRHYEPYNHFWTGIDAEYKISKKVRIGLDIPYRRQSLDKGSLKVLQHLHWYGVRLWTTIRLSDKVFLNISPIAYLYELPPTNKREGLKNWQDEARFSIRLRYAPEGSILTHRYGLERRYRRDNDHNYWQEYRVRYMLRLNKEIYNGLRIVATEEIFINMGKAIAYDIFELNRLFLGVRESPTPGFEITAGYQNILDLLSSEEAFTVVHALTITFSLNSTLND